MSNPFFLFLFVVLVGGVIATFIDKLTGYRTDVWWKQIIHDVLRMATGGAILMIILHTTK